ncbi:MAG: RlmE family RNA methyltransferase [Deltaproteobacteria bacterium]|nr:RlmE family RNA methyltransferase [Deltaproteobacteria bacterium]
MKKYRDHYFLKAKQEHYPARSVYKLKEINARFHLFRPGQKVLDLGAAPGSWCMGAAELVGEGGLVLGLDLRPAEVILPPQVRFMQGDIFDPSPEFAEALRACGPFDLVLSDMAPSTTGHRSTDQARSAALAFEALALARRCLIPGGAFVVKFFMGPDIQALAGELRVDFERVRAFKPQSSRSESMESFYIAAGYKGIREAASTTLKSPGT